MIFEQKGCVSVSLDRLSLEIEDLMRLIFVISLTINQEARPYGIIFSSKFQLCCFFFVKPNRKQSFAENFHLFFIMTYFLTKTVRKSNKTITWMQRMDDCKRKKNLFHFGNSL